MVVSSDVEVMVVVKAFWGGVVEVEVEGWVACERISRGPVRSRVSRSGWVVKRTLRGWVGGDILMRVAVVGFDAGDELDERLRIRRRGVNRIFISELDTSS